MKVLLSACAGCAVLACGAFTTVVEPLPGEKWWGGVVNDGEPIMRAMEYEFPRQGFETENVQYMLGPKWLVAPVVREDDAVTVRLPAGTWRDDLGATHVGPKTLELRDVPVARLPRFERLAS